MIGRFGAIAVTCAITLSSGCRAEPPVDLLYDAMARPTQSVVFMVWVNDFPSPLGVIPLVQGLDDGFPVGGSSGAAMTVPANPQMPGRTIWQVRWIDYPSGQAWQADFPLELKTFPADEKSNDPFTSALNARMERAGGQHDTRRYEVTLHFEPGGVLTA